MGAGGQGGRQLPPRRQGWGAVGWQGKGETPYPAPAHSHRRPKGMAAAGLGVDPRDGGGSLGVQPCPDPAAAVGKADSSPSCVLPLRGHDGDRCPAPLPKPRGPPTAGSIRVGIPPGWETGQGAPAHSHITPGPTHWGHSLPAKYLQGFLSAKPNTKKFISQPRMLVLPSQDQASGRKGCAQGLTRGDGRR